jgi:hypothetical protein
VKTGAADASGERVGGDGEVVFETVEDEFAVLEFPVHGHFLEFFED